MNKINIKNWTLFVYFPKINKSIVEMPEELLNKFECTNEELKSIFSFWMGNFPKESTIELNKEKIIQNISNVFKLSNEVLPGKGKIYSIILPTFDEFIINNLEGCSGYVAYRDTIWFYINPNAKSQSIQELVCHEYHHLKRREIYTESEVEGTEGEISLKEQLVADGLAEHFKEKIMKTKQASYTKVLNEEEINDLLEKLKDQLDSKDREFINKIFYGGDSYKNSTGYTLGYWIIKRFLQNYPNLNWEELTKLPPDRFFNF
tara:strand:- start:244 stop:1026 length:783 start_codon:yes stop_codon:yes gene_type:complete